MTKQHFVALADTLRSYNETCLPGLQINNAAIEALASFCAAQNPAFNRARWLTYIAGDCGPNGGARKK